MKRDWCDVNRRYVQEGYAGSDIRKELELKACTLNMLWALAGA